MRPHPAELAGLDLYEMWSGAEELGDQLDPFRFDHRMAAYRQLIHATNHNGQFDEDNRRNPLWGLMFQHQWQFRTDRLGAHGGQIDPDAAWGYGNYALAIIPWLGAVAAGTVPDIPVAGPSKASRFRYGAEEFAGGVADWRDYFTLVAEGQSSVEQLRFALWKAHKTCLDVVATHIASIDPTPYSPLELTFLRGWCRMVDYLWVAAWPTDFDFMTQHGLDVLPEQLLEDRGTLAALPGKVRRNVRNIVALAGLPGWRHKLNLALWRRVMRTSDARQQVLPMLDAVFNPRKDNVADRRRMVRYLLGVSMRRSR